MYILFFAQVLCFSTHGGGGSGVNRYQPLTFPSCTELIVNFAPNTSHVHASQLRQHHLEDHAFHGRYIRESGFSSVGHDIFNIYIGGGPGVSRYQPLPSPLCTELVGNFVPNTSHMHASQLRQHHLEDYALRGRYVR